MFSVFYEQYDAIASSQTILVDTREHRTEAYDRRINGIITMDGFHMDVRRQKLDVGDYSSIANLGKGLTIDFSDKVAIERKATLDEFLGNICGDDRDRFEKELRRAKDKNCRLIIAIESGSYDDLINGRFAYPISVKSAVGTYHAYEHRFGVHFVFVTPDSFPAFVDHTMRRTCLDYLCEKFPNGIIY